MTQTREKEQLGHLPEWQMRDLNTPPTLVDDELHLWFVPLVLSEDQQHSAIDLLNANQRDKYHRRATPELKSAYLAGRYHLIKLLSAYNDIPAQEVRISYSRLNKPYLNPNPRNIQFNFTDTFNDNNSVGLFTFTRRYATGVDIESFDRQSNFAGIVNKRFAPAETEHVMNEHGEINARRFLAYWTRKEAYGKATGQGINFKMNEMDLASPNAFDLKFEDAEQAFSLKQIQIGQDLIASVVHQGHQAMKLKAFRLE